MPAGAIRTADSVVESIGAVIHLEGFNSAYGNYSGVVLPALSSAGFRYLRAGIDDHTSTYNPTYLSYMSDLASRGFRFSLVVPDGTCTCGPYNLANLASGVAAVGGASAIDALEGANEPNLSGNTSWASISASFQASLYATVTGDPTLSGIKLVGPGLAGLGTAPLTVGNLSDSTSGLGNWHTYSGGIWPEDMTQKDQGSIYSYLQEAANVYGSPMSPSSLTITEMGYTTANMWSGPWVTEDIKTRFLPRLFLWNYLIGVHRTYVHQLIDTRIYSATDGNSAYGLIDFYGTYKASYNGIKSLISMFSDPTPFTPTPVTYQVGYVYGRNIVSALFAKSDGSYLAPIWLGEQSWDWIAKTAVTVPTQAVTITIPSTVATVTATTLNDDGTTTVSTYTPSSGRFSMTITDRITVITFTP